MRLFGMTHELGRVFTALRRASRSCILAQIERRVPEGPVYVRPLFSSVAHKGINNLQGTEKEKSKDLRIDYYKMPYFVPLWFILNDSGLTVISLRLRGESSG